MSASYQITIPELEALMRDALARAGWKESAIAEYVDAQTRYGLLRPGTSDADLSIAEIWYYIPPASGF